MQGFEVNQRVSPDELQVAFHDERFLFAPCGFITRRSDIGLALLRQQANAINELSSTNSIPCGSGYIQDQEDDFGPVDIIRSIAYSSYRWAQANKTLYSEPSLGDRYELPSSQCWGIHPCRVFELLQTLIGTRLSSDYVADLPNNYRLDKLMFHSVSNLPGHGSTQWHRDSVGNRLKIFLVLEAANMSPTTAIVNNSQFELAYAMNLDLVRTLQAPDGSKNIGLAKPIQDQITERLVQRFRASAAVIKQEKGSILVFDTNSWHMAWKPCMQGSDESQDSRLVLELEFMDKHRSNFAADFLGPCGPGQNLLYWYIEDEIKHLMDFFRIDLECTQQSVSLHDNSIKYYSNQARNERWHEVIASCGRATDQIRL